MAPGWPVTLREGQVALRPIRRQDAKAWREVRVRNADWLRPWESSVPDPVREPAPTYAGMVRRLRLEAREGRTLPFAVTYGGAFVGQLTINGVVGGSLRACSIGYWIDQRVAGRGITPTAVALAIDHAFGPLGLHRVEICIRPENGPSRRVVEKLGLTIEGVRPRFLHIDGDWRDHVIYVITTEEVDPGGMIGRWRAIQAARGNQPL
jgi:ribosomal-protein-alanine N-acetyltransferase